jgi:PAS domain S-box-containing protein
MKPEIKLTTTFAIGLLIIVVVGVSSFFGFQQIAESNRMVAHTHEVLEKLEQILSLHKDAETGQRGFVLTGEERYLEPYNQAVGEIGKQIDSLASLTKDNPAQQQSIHQLAQFSQDKLDELRTTIKLRREGGLAKALAVIRSDRGKRKMDEIRTIVVLMKDREWQLLEKRNRIAGETALDNSRRVGIGMLLTLLMLTAAAVVMTRSLRFGERSTQSGNANGKWPGIAARYSFALAMVALAMLLRQWVVSSFGPLPIFIMFYPAVLLVASIAGSGPGILTTVLSLLAADYWYFPPYGQFGLSSSNDAIALGIFGSSSMFLSVFAERLHRTRITEAVNVTQEQQLALLDMGNLLALDLDRRIVRWSQGCSRLYGFEAQEAEGHLVDELLQTRNSQSWEQILRSLLEQGYWEGETSRRCKSGTELSLTILLALRRDLQGNPLAILEVSTDLTPQKSVETALLENEARLHAANDRLQVSNEQLQAQTEELQTQREELQSQAEELHAQNKELAMLWDESRLTKEVLAKSRAELTLALNSAGMGAFEWDIVNDKRSWDDNVHRLLMINPLTFTGTTEEFYRVIHPDDRAAVQSSITEALNTNGAYESEYRTVWPDGTICHIAARGKISRDNGGQPVQMTGVCWDITERKHAEEEMQQAKEAAEAATRVKSQFLANMSHELRTPMTGVLGMLDLAIEGPLEAKQRGFIETAQTSARSLVRILNDILDLTKIEAGKLSIENKPFPIRTCMENIFNIFIPVAKGKGLDFYFTVADNVPRYLVGDQTRLSQVLTNLAGNAVKFTEKGALVMGVVAGGITLGGKREVTFTVTDTGIGIPEDKMDQLFRIFSQVDESHTREYGGTGLGLAISKEIVERMGGTIRFTSTEGKGSSFTFTIPFVEAETVCDDILETVKTVTVLGVPNVEEITIPRLLIAEDDPTIRQILGNMLQRLNHEVCFAENGKIAVDMWEGGKFDLILMDIQMPLMNGFDATASIREKESSRGGHTPIIAMTAHASKDDEKRCLAAGMDVYISKPIDFKKTLQLIGDIIKAGRFSGVVHSD